MQGCWTQKIALYVQDEFCMLANHCYEARLRYHIRYLSQLFLIISVFQSISWRKLRTGTGKRTEWKPKTCESSDDLQLLWLIKWVSMLCAILWWTSLFLTPSTWQIVLYSSVLAQETYTHTPIHFPPRKSGSHFSSAPPACIVISLMVVQLHKVWCAWLKDGGRKGTPLTYDIASKFFLLLHFWVDLGSSAEPVSTDFQYMAVALWCVKIAQANWHIELNGAERSNLEQKAGHVLVSSRFTAFHKTQSSRKYRNDPGKLNKPLIQLLCATLSCNAHWHGGRGRGKYAPVTHLWLEIQKWARSPQIFWQKWYWQCTPHQGSISPVWSCS